MAGLDPAILSYVRRRVVVSHWMAASEGGHDVERLVLSAPISRRSPDEAIHDCDGLS
jgi:hypothetical protein